MGVTTSSISDQPPQDSSRPQALVKTDSEVTMRPPKPTRRVDLPPELWSMIMKHTRDNDDVDHMTTREPGERRLDGPSTKTRDAVGNRTTLALASTCRLIRSVADPFLWDRLSFYLPCLPESDEPSAAPRPGNVKLIQERGKVCLAFLKKNPEVRDLVKEFSVYMGSDVPQDDGSHALAQLFSSFSRLLPMLPNLDSISITGASIPLDFLSSIAQLGPKVQHLSIVNCRWPNFPLTLPAPSLRLKSIRLKGEKWVHPWLDQFIAHSDALESAEVDASFPGKNPKKFPKLKSLWVKEVHARDVDRFCRTLSHCPDLEELTLVEAMMDPTFHKACLPRLRILRGNILNCVFVEGRPVDTIDLSYPTPNPCGPDLELNIMFRRVLEVCASGTVPVTKFKIVTGTYGSRYRWGSTEVAALVETFPHLEFLDVDIDPTSFYQSVPPITHLHNLQALCFRLPRTAESLTMDWQLQHKDALMMLGNLGNTLTNVAMTDGVEWVKGPNGWYGLDHLAA